jgi:hypothetical protein
MNQNRPTSIYVIAVFGVIFGIMGLCLCAPGSLAQIFVPQPTEFGSITIPPPQYSPIEKSLLVFSLFLTIPASALLIAGSIGSFYLKPWARWCVIAYAVLTIVGNLLFNMGNIRAANAQSQAVMQGFFPGVAVPGGVGMLSMVFGVIAGTVCNSLFPIIALIVYNLKSVRLAFSGDRSGFGPPPPGGYGPPPAAWQGYPQQNQYYGPPQPQPPPYPDPNQGPYPPPQYGAPAPPMQPPPPNYYPPAPPYPGDEMPPPRRE